MKCAAQQGAIHRPTLSHLSLRALVIFWYSKRQEKIVFTVHFDVEWLHIIRRGTLDLIVPPPFFFKFMALTFKKTR